MSHSDQPMLTIHRGASEIGGSCVELQVDGCRIVLDLGAPLSNPDGSPFDDTALADRKPGELIASGVLPDVSGLYDRDSAPAPDAILISHAHQDHYGLAHYARKSIPRYCTAATRALIELTWAMTGSRDRSFGAHVPFAAGTPFSIGPFTVTPYPMDHSAFDATAFVVEVGGATVIYTGDFRRHGRKGRCWERFVRQAPKGAGALLLEGTTLGRPERQTQRDEAWVERNAARHMEQARDPFLFYCSAQNIDRIISFYRAARRTGRTFVVDVYTANVLATVARERPSIPHPGRFRDLRVFFPYRLTTRIVRHVDARLAWRMAPFKITREELAARAGEIAMLVRPSILPDLQRIDSFHGGVFCYSLWHGYRQDPRTQDLLAWTRRRGFRRCDLHVSGHADPRTLRETVQRLAPAWVIPIHTACPEQYADRLATRVQRLEDGVTWTLPVTDRGQGSVAR